MHTSQLSALLCYYVIRNVLHSTSRSVRLSACLCMHAWKLKKLQTNFDEVFITRQHSLACRANAIVTSFLSICPTHCAIDIYIYIYIYIYISIFKLSDRAITLVFPHYTWLRNSSGKAACNSGWLRKSRNFRSSGVNRLTKCAFD